MRVFATGSLGRFEIEITPDHLAQSHMFRFDIDQSYFEPFLKRLGRLLVRLEGESARRA